MRAARLLVTGVFIATFLFAAAARAQESLEYSVKAAFLLNFVRFIEWPETAFADAGAPIHICTFIDNPFGDTLEKLVQGETASGRPLAVRNARGPAELAPCHMIFVPSSSDDRAAPVFRHSGAPAVVVGESNRFLARGGAVNLFIEGGRVRFDVNLGPIEQRGIRVSARMLQLATHVGRPSTDK